MAESNTNPAAEPILKSVQTAHQIQGAVKTGKAIAGMAKGRRTVWRYSWTCVGKQKNNCKGGCGNRTCACNSYSFYIDAAQPYIWRFKQYRGK